LKLIVIGLVGTAAITPGLADTLAIGDAVGQGPDVGLGVVTHSRIDRAGGVVPTGAPATSAGAVGVADGLGAGAGPGVGIHARIDCAGRVEAAGSPATSVRKAIAPSAEIMRPASILVLNMAKPSVHVHRNIGVERPLCSDAFWYTEFSSVIAFHGTGVIVLSYDSRRLSGTKGDAHARGTTIRRNAHRTCVLFAPAPRGRL
jgi:hypothetical protein